MPLKLYGAEIIQSRVMAPSVIESFQVSEDGTLRSRLGGPQK